MVASSVIDRQCFGAQGLRGLVSEELFLCLPTRNVNCPRVALMASAPSTPSPSKRGEVDTSRPYTDVREAILRFDHHPVQSSAEKRAHESPVVGSLKEQLAEAVAAKAKAESDNSVIEKELAELKLKLEQALATHAAAGNDGHAADGAMLGGLYQELLASKGRVETLEAQILASSSETEKALEQAASAEASAARTLEAITLLHEEGEAKIEKTEAQVETLSTELTLIREQEQVLKSRVSTLTEKITELKAELDKANTELAVSKQSEEKALASLGETAAEVKNLEVRLKESEDEKNTLQATNRYLEPELESTKAELEAVRIENAGEDAAAKYKAKLDAAIASMSKSEETVAGLLDALEQVLAEVIEARAVSDAVQAQVESLREETKALKLACEAADKNVEEVYKDVEAAKTGEANAVEAVKSLAGGTENEQVAKIDEVENSTSVKISEAEAEVEVTREREAELKVKLKDARAEIESSRIQVQQANDKAASAEAAKSAVEGELRRWRSENEQRRKQAQALITSGNVNAAQAPPPLVNGAANAAVDTKALGVKEEEYDRSMNVKEVEPKEKLTLERRLSQQHGESLAQVLQMNLPAKQEQHAKQKKKLKLLARLGAVFSSKKKLPSS